ncbi:Short-chain dehydrogenase/reductase SDR (plasmid) [Pseudovibrio sp. FO-BEG1]|uniref:SDR family oxidoreductase n=1 Tax=Pseudovibrio sp. (strain FO-BEG1) TaxID=911045 RepID=UPI000238CBEE|nr:SDR family oxidoreductase [Pseudovibrio sp. FO-BEG1]AEV39758.1 Short-chain dehydrogenase/reductase SDR [Pseudovibrio sp. FO-BEG1]
MELHGQTIIVTGASSGIGAAAAELFASEGANVVLGARREAELAKLAGGITEQGGSATYLAGDVTDETYAAALVEHALNTYGRLHGAFNNAGIMGDMEPVPEMDTDNWNGVLRTNLTSAFYAAKAQIPVLKNTSQSAIVFTSSFVGHTNSGMPGMGAYAASKAGLVGLVKSLAADHGPDGIRVNALLPGGTKTAMAGDDPEGHAFISNLHPLKRMANPKEIAQAALFLLSDRASFVTGSAMTADGGVSIRLV